MDIGLPEESTERLRRIAENVRDSGGRALIVGGAIRDRILERPVRDIDIEVLGLDLEKLEEILCPYGRTMRIGRSFESIRIARLDVDFSVPESPECDFAEASRRRDLTLNSMGFDPLTGEVLDPHDGKRDIERRILRATDPLRFGEDPVRALRVARLCSELSMRADSTLIDLCSEQDLSRVPGERIFSEIRRTLLDSPRPSTAFRFLEESSLLRFFPELKALVGVPQDPRWHPEGDVWVHTLMVVDAAAKLRAGNAEDPPLMFAALCHDLGKPDTTVSESGGGRAFGHNRRGAQITRSFLARMRAPSALTERVEGLVEHHLAPAQFVQNGAGPGGYRRLARRLEGAGLCLAELERLARADHLGRGVPEARRAEFSVGDRFLAQASAHGVEAGARPDVVRGRHLIARGIEPGPGLGKILQRCRALQDETGITDPEEILARIL